MVFSYILFDVLDLDGSNLSSLLPAVERVFIVAVVPSDIEFTHSPERAEPLANLGLPWADESGKYLRLQRAKASGSSPLDSARSHGYRVGLARDSVQDSSPYG